jgi:DNA adenine methylase
MNKPLLKWAGNKYRVLPHLIPHIGYPKRYCEPFAGSLAVALNTPAEQYILNDVNKDLVAIYQNLVNPNDDNFIKYCEELFIPENNTREVYSDLVKHFNQTTNSTERARLFIYLNRHCFNGLSRYNKKGEFNVPYGREFKNKETGEKYIQDAYFPREEMMNFRMYFLQRKHSFTSLSFEDSALYHGLETGDVVYFDPPYVPASETANFTSYATDGFTHDQQVQLAQLAESLATKGIKVIVSNHNTPVTQELYKNATIYPIQVSRTIAAKGGSRKKAEELIAVYSC